MNFKIYNMDVFEGLQQMQNNNELVDCVMTSPPYWGLRDYGVEGQLGLEKHPNEYINNIVKVFRETKKVLKDSGSLWLNIGDSYYGGSGCAYDGSGGVGAKNKVKNTQRTDLHKHKSPWMQTKQKLLMPHRVAIAMQDDGWILRNDVVWHKPSHMPSSVQDRLTNSFEYLFHFVMKKKYYYDLDAIREPCITGNGKKWGSRLTPGRLASIENPKHGKISRDMKNDQMVNNLLGKNPGDMWSINPKPYPEAHFACYPPALIESPLKATCPKEVCSKCGAARERITKPTKEYLKAIKKAKLTPAWSTERRKQANKIGNALGARTGREPRNYETIGWSDCGCKAGFNPGIVLDPFVGSGTTLMEAQNQKKSGIGIELNPDYIKFIRKRLNGGEYQESLNPNKIEVIDGKA